jgi:hypothetical protein
MTYIKGHFTCLGCNRETAVDDFFEGEFPRWELAMQDRFFRELIHLRERNELRPTDYAFTCGSCSSLSRPAPMSAAGGISVRSASESRRQPLLGSGLPACEAANQNVFA